MLPVGEVPSNVADKGSGDATDSGTRLATCGRVFVSSKVHPKDECH